MGLLVAMISKYATAFYQKKYRDPMINTLHATIECCAKMNGIHKILWVVEQYRIQTQVVISVYLRTQKVPEDSAKFKSPWRHHILQG